MTNFIRDDNHVPVAGGVSSASASTTLPFKIDSSTGRLLVDNAGGGSGDVVGPASATDNAVVRFDGTTGKLVQNSAVIIADTTGVISGTQGVTLSGSTSGTIALVPTAIAGTNTITFPASTGTVALTSDISDNITVGTTTVTSGTDTRILYDNTGTLGQYAISGTGSVAMTNSPTLVTPALGTPSSATLTNATGLPISSGVSGLGTGVATALAVNTGSAGAVVLFDGALGTPSSGTVTNLTGTASININGTVGATTPASGAFTTLSASSTLTASTTIELGHATDTTLSRSSAGVLAVEGVVIPSISSTNTLTNKRITKRVQAVASSATVTGSLDNDDMVTITAQAEALTLANPSGTGTQGQPLVYRIKDNGTARAISYGANFRAIGVTLPTTTVISKTIYLGGFWNSTDTKLDIVAVAEEA